jgi:hypothetical protein
LIDFLAPQYSGIARGRRLEKLDWPVCALLRPEFPDRLTIGPSTSPARRDSSLLARIVDHGGIARRRRDQRLDVDESHRSEARCIGAEKIAANHREMDGGNKIVGADRHRGLGAEQDG